MGIVYTLHFFPNTKYKEKMVPLIGAPGLIHHLCSASNPNIWSLRVPNITKGTPLKFAYLYLNESYNVPFFINHREKIFFLGIT